VIQHGKEKHRKKKPGGSNKDRIPKKENGKSLKNNNMGKRKKRENKRKRKNFSGEQKDRDRRIFPLKGEWVRGNWKGPEGRKKIKKNWRRGGGRQ